MNYLAKVPAERGIGGALQRKWRMRLAYWGENCFEEREREMIATAQRELEHICAARF